MRLIKILLTLVIFIFGYLVVSKPIIYAQAAPSDIQVDPISGPSLDKKLTTHAKSSWPRYIARDAGLIAADLLVLLIVSGVGLVTGLTFKFIEPLTAWAVHRAMGLAFATAVVLHIFILLFDRINPYKLTGLLLPFAAGSRSLYLAFGVIAFYGIIAICLTSLFWTEKKPHTWKLFHLISYAVMALVFFHALYLGTDLSHGLTRFLWKLGGLIILVLVLGRIRRTYSL